MGRPTAAVIRAAVDAVRCGEAVSVVAERHGVLPVTVQRWLGLEDVRPTTDDPMELGIHHATDYLDTPAPPPTPEASPPPVQMEVPPGLTAWRKPSGGVVFLNGEEATIEAARRLGWEPME